jgi:hypothetical protein
MTPMNAHFLLVHMLLGTSRTARRLALAIPIREENAC